MFFYKTCDWNLNLNSNLKIRTKIKYRLYMCCVITDFHKELCT